MVLDEENGVGLDGDIGLGLEKGVWLGPDGRTGVEFGEDVGIGFIGAFFGLSVAFIGETAAACPFHADSWTTSGRGPRQDVKIIAPNTAMT